MFLTFLFLLSQGDRPLGSLPLGSFCVWARGPDPLAHVMIGMTIVYHEGEING